MTLNISEAQSLLDKIALEVTLAAPGGDQGLLPVNNLISELRERELPLSLSEKLKAALSSATARIDKIFEGTGNFTLEDLTYFRNWVGWAQDLFLRFSQNGPLPDFAIAPQQEIENDQSAPNAVSAAAAERVEYSIRLDLENNSDLLREFLQESRDHLQVIEAGIMQLEANPEDGSVLDAMFRAFHTFKGGSGFLNLKPINHLAHEFETLLDGLRKHQLSVCPEIIELILEGADSLGRFLQAIEENLKNPSPGPINLPIQTLLTKIKCRLDSDPTPAADAPASVPPEQLGSGKGADPVAPAETDSVHAKPGGGALSGTSGNIVKVDTFKLDTLVDLIGELVITHSMVSQDASWQHTASQNLTRNLTQLARITDELQRTAMSLRMVPIRATFQKMRRLVRDLAVKAGKNVRLELEGEETELDRKLVEEIHDPLMHMVRNAVDHGIESAATRLKAGKPAEGAVRLRAYHKGGNIVIEISDDGAGLNTSRIREKAASLGWIRAGRDPSEAELYRFIFQPGFSTAEKITDISGRGVGMDVVRQNVEKLSGKIEIHSEFGKGSRFSIFLPLTLAIIDGLIVRVGTHRYVLPVVSVRESFRAGADLIYRIQNRGEVVKIRGQLQPLLRLGQFLQVDSDSATSSDGIAIMVEADNSTRCLLVDELIGKQEVVIKSLGDLFKLNRAIAGAAILGDGKVGLIVDINAIVKLDTRKAA